MSATRFAIISDIHAGPDGGPNGTVRRLGSHALKLVEDFTERMNNVVKPDFVIQLGDPLTFTTPRDDIKNLTDVLDRLGRLSAPLHHVVGNHEQVHFSEGGIRQLLNMPSLYYSFDHDSYHFIILFAKVEAPPANFGFLPSEQLAWLRNDLHKAGKPTVVFLHYALADYQLSGNVWFERYAYQCLLERREYIRKILAESGKVIGVFNGHIHASTTRLHDGIPHISVQSLVENVNNDGIPAASCCLVQLEPGKLKVEVEGRDPLSVTHSWNLDLAAVK